MNQYALILAGGSGTRFWPLSRDHRPKQLLNMFGEGTLLRQAIDRLDGLVPRQNIFILTNHLQEAEVRRQAHDIPVDNMLGNPLFTRYYMSKFDEKLFNHDEFCVVSPDVGSVARSRTFAAKVHMGLAIVDKRRQRANMCEVMNIIGDVEGKTCILFDDIVDTAGSLCNAAEAIKTIGKAKAVYACASHGVLSGNATQRIEDSCIEELMVLNTIPLPADYTGKKIRQLDASPIFAKAITRIYNETSISSLF